MVDKDLCRQLKKWDFDVQDIPFESYIRKSMMNKQDVSLDLDSTLLSKSKEIESALRKLEWQQEDR